MPRMIRRRFATAIMAAATALALAGCVTMKTHITYHADKTLDASILMAIDKSLAESSTGSGGSAADIFGSLESSDEMADLKKELGDQLTIEPYDQDGQVGVHMTLRGVTPEQLARVNAAQSAPSGETSLTVDGDTMTLEYHADPAATEDIGGGMLSLDSMGMDASALDAVFDIDARHTFPGPVVSTTIGHIDPDDPRTVVIDSYADLVDSDGYTIVAKTSAGAEIPWRWIGIASVVLLAAMIGTVAWWRSRGAAASDPAPQAVAAAPGAPPPPPPPV